MRKRVGQRVRDLDLAHHPQPALVVVELVAALRRRLGRVHGGVGVSQERVGVGAGLGDHDAEAGADPLVAVARRERLAEGGDDPLGDGDRVTFSRDALEDERELVAAEPRNGVARAHRLVQPGRDRHQQLVAGGVAEGVVHQLEVVDVHQHDGDLRSGPRRPRERLAQAIAEERPVRKARQRIVEGLILETPLELVLGRDVANDRLDPGRLGVAEHAPARDLDEYPGTVLAHHLDVGDPMMRPFEAARHQRAGAIDVLGGDQVDDPHLEYLLAGVAGQTLGGTGWPR